jgi:hypothetical protein
MKKITKKIARVRSELYSRECVEEGSAKFARRSRAFSLRREASAWPGSTTALPQRPE